VFLLGCGSLWVGQSALVELGEKRDTGDMWGRAAVGVLVVCLVLGACETDSGPTSTSTSTVFVESTAPTTLAVAPTDARPGFQVEADGRLSEWEGRRATLTVPLDYADPEGESVDLPVWRWEATEPENRVGVLLVNPGGPGFPAGWMVQNARTEFTGNLRSRFDIVALDPRGTFRGTQAACVPVEELLTLDVTPDTAEEVAAVDAVIQASVDGCAADYARLLPHVSTMDTVHDFAVLVQALGEEKVSYLGRSYGTVLGAAFVTTYPELVRAATLDAAIYSHADPLEDEVAAVEAFEATLIRIFHVCDSAADCPIQGAAQDTFMRVSSAADTDPLDSDPQLPVVNQAAFRTIIERNTFNSSDVELLLAAVAAADAGDSAWLQQMYSDVLDLFSAASGGDAIYCMDWPYRGESPLPDNTAAILAAAAPVTHTVFPTSINIAPIPGLCERWPVGPDPLPAPLSGQGAGPVLVVASTGDTITPLEGAQQLASELVNATLLITEHNQHGSYEPFSGNEARRCATDTIDAFLIDPTIPLDQEVCSP
jgi:pimeloyl-ACP methyl ester carboxylesterase